MSELTPPTHKPKTAEEPLIGWMILEDHCEDMSDWSGVISFPDPTGANLAWENPTKMIEHSAFEKLREENERLKKVERWARELASINTRIGNGDSIIVGPVLTKLREALNGK